MGLDWVVVGTGMMARIILPTIRHIGDNVVGVVGRSQEGIEAYLSDPQVRMPADTPRWTFDEYQEALNDSGADAVAILTPNFMHADMGKAAARAGKHILIEKPLATSVHDGEAFLGAVGADIIAVDVNSQYRHHEVFGEIARIVESGEFGKPTYIRMGYTQDWQIKPTDAIGWRPEVEIAGYGKLVPDLGSHTMQTTLHIFGGEFIDFNGKTYNVHPVRYKPKDSANVQSFGAAGIPPPTEKPDLWETMDMLDRDRYSGDDIATANFMLKTDQGVHVPGDYLLSQVHQGHKNKFTIELAFEQGRIYWDQENPNHLIIAGKDGQEYKFQRGSDSLGITGSPPGHGHGYETSIALELLKLREVIESKDQKRIMNYTHRNVSQAVQTLEMCEKWLADPIVCLPKYEAGK